MNAHRVNEPNRSGMRKLKNVVRGLLKEHSDFHRMTVFYGRHPLWTFAEKREFEEDVSGPCKPYSGLEVEEVTNMGRLHFCIWLKEGAYPFL